MRQGDVTRRNSRRRLRVRVRPLCATRPADASGGAGAPRASVHRIRPAPPHGASQGTSADSASRPGVPVAEPSGADRRGKGAPAVGVGKECGVAGARAPVQSGRCAPGISCAYSCQSRPQLGAGSTLHRNSAPSAAAEISIFDAPSARKKPSEPPRIPPDWLPPRTVTCKSVSPFTK